VRLAEGGDITGSDGDFAALMARLLVFSTWRLALLSRLRDSADPVLAAVAANGVKELAYHRDYAAQWVIRLGDGTDYSRELMAAGLATVAPLVPELFEPTEIETRLAGVAVDPAELRPEFDAVLDIVLTEATLEWPSAPGLAAVSGQTGRDGVHTEDMGYLLAELQSVARAMPGATW
jgi:ring-1,2-phenylacetyl-CoA epoxidase subunit PaaC